MLAPESEISTVLEAGNVAAAPKNLDPDNAGGPITRATGPDVHWQLSNLPRTTEIAKRLPDIPLAEAFQHSAQSKCEIFR